MQNDASSHHDLIAALDREMRRMGAQNIVTSQTVADRFGLHTTDLECLDLLFMRKAATPGELAAATGLSSGAMTALLDRLERAGYVERQADPGDRRRVLLHIKAEAIKPIEAVYGPMQARMQQLWAGYSQAELATIVDFLKRSTDLAVACVEDMRQDATAPKRGRRKG
ncbi:MarR family winged helix-turn-helix transcriptional regulator [Aminobacter carboxidus]|uniref:MarR family transcriptional regulator n=1 Tax=Aminobacter carboxidus TaxID=376165 RepID=A0ABR9GLI4_9HYPH|nr:MarR family transcriptional regulator [Aminobacter carboxidus]MBE1204534.1 MarR family transcriptional regulator [Aminobacter carboxidus]